MMARPPRKWGAAGGHGNSQPSEAPTPSPVSDGDADLVVQRVPAEAESVEQAHGAARVRARPQTTQRTGAAGAKAITPPGGSRKSNERKIMRSMGTGPRGYRTAVREAVASGEREQGRSARPPRCRSPGGCRRTREP